MSDPFIGEIRLFTAPRVPSGWLPCDGRLVSIQQYQALFAVCGTRYGGDGRTTFGLPNLVGRAVMQSGTGPGLTARNFAQTVGDESIVLTAAQLPPHAHQVNTMVPASAPDASKLKASPTGNMIGRGVMVNATGPATNVQVFSRPPLAQPTTLDPGAVGTTPAGTAQPHENRQPFLALNFFIAYLGDFPINP